MSGSYSAPGVVPGGTVQVVFGLYTSEVSNAPMTNGSFTYVVPDGLTATGFNSSPYCPDVGSTLVGDTLTIQGLTQDISFSCQITLDLTADDLGTYPLSPSTLTYTTTGTDTFEMVAGANSSLIVTPAPTVTGLIPGWAGKIGRPDMTIRGTNFLTAREVTVGGVSAPFEIISDTEISYTAPAQPVGSADVIVVGVSGPSANTPDDDLVYLEGIPTLSEWAMILFGLTLAGAAVVMVQRRRTA